MNALRVEDIQPNAYFDAPVYLDEHYVLVSPDVQVTPELLERLRRWGYQSVYTDGTAAEAPSYMSGVGMANTASVLDVGIRERQQMEAAKKLYYALLNFAVEDLKRFKEEGKLYIGRITERMKALIDMLKGSRDAVLRYPEFSFQSENYVYPHSLNTAILSLAVGDLLKLPPHRMIELGIAALLHDIGMLKIPEAFYLGSRPLEPKEMQMVRAHTTLGYRILKSFSLSEDIGLAAYEHHERMDGSGYPRGLKAEKISLFSRIIAAACSYDAMANKRQFREARGMHNGLLELLKERNRLFDEKVVRALVLCLSPYPLGSLVRLGDNSVARVVKTNPESPKFPFVQLLVDKDGNRVTEPVIVKTEDASGPTIQRALTSEEAARLPR
jgi:putative nucleotidyltransferase with HDIG domain